MLDLILATDCASFLFTRAAQRGEGAGDKGAQLRVVGGQHHEYQHDGVDEHAVVVKAAQGLRQGW